jgi:hypothetical protein
MVATASHAQHAVLLGSRSRDTVHPRRLTHVNPAQHATLPVCSRQYLAGSAKPKSAVAHASAPSLFGQQQHLSPVAALSPFSFYLILHSTLSPSLIRRLFILAPNIMKPVS